MPSEFPYQKKKFFLIDGHFSVTIFNLLNSIHSFISMEKKFICFLLCKITDLLWSKSKRRNSVEEFGDVPPHKMAKCIKGPIFVTLAGESPARHYDSEDSTYDSFHARETGKQVEVRLKCVSIFILLG